MTLESHETHAETEATERARLSEFFAKVAASAQSILLTDFDGTLAPFRVDPAIVQPWSGVRELLHAIQSSGRTQLAIISGRPAADVLERSGLAALHVWGLHGAEHLFPDGHLECTEPSKEHRLAMVKSEEMLGQLLQRSRFRIEKKRNGIAVHWRGLSGRLVGALRQGVLGILSPIAESSGMRLLDFDCGIELIAGPDKGDVIRTLLGQSPGIPAAFLGDDTTDEDAFREIAGQGLGVLVRPERGESAASIWLRPPGQLRDFLSAWVLAVGSSKSVRAGG